MANKHHMRLRPSSVGLVCDLPLTNVVTGVLYRDRTGNGFTGTATNGPVVSYPGTKFDRTSDQFVDVGAGPTSVSTLAFWIKPTDFGALQRAMDLNGTDYIQLANASGVITAVGFAGGTAILYIDSVVGTSGVAALTTNWQHVVVTDTVAKNASDFDIGRRDTFEVSAGIAEVRLYSTVLAAHEVRNLFEAQRWRYRV